MLVLVDHEKQLNKQNIMDFIYRYIQSTFLMAKALNDYRYQAHSWYPSRNQRHLGNNQEFLSRMNRKFVGLRQRPFGLFLKKQQKLTKLLVGTLWTRKYPDWDWQLYKLLFNELMQRRNKKLMKHLDLFSSDQKGHCQYLGRISGKILRRQYLDKNHLSHQHVSIYDSKHEKNSLLVLNLPDSRNR